MKCLGGEKGFQEMWSQVPVEQFGRLGGIVPEPEEIVNALKKVM